MLTRATDDSSGHNASSDPRYVAATAQNLDLWRITLTADGASCGSMLSTLSQAEQERAARYQFDVDRRRFVIARSSLRRILGRYAGIKDAEVAFEYGQHGKPLLVNQSGDSGIRFNLSHSADIALCAVALSTEVGVDVEQIRREIDVHGIAAQFFSAEEQRVLANASDPHETFARIWVRKEAYVKATGHGIGADLQGFTVSLAEVSTLRGASGADPGAWAVREIAVPSGYAAAVVSSEPLHVREFVYLR